MDWDSAIRCNKHRAGLLYKSTPFVLPRMEISEYRDNKKIIPNESIVERNLPKAKKQFKITPIAPAAIIDERPERGKEKVTERAPAPIFHRHWYNYMVIPGHNAWVTSVSVDPSNKFFVTGSIDRMLKFWRLAEAELSVTLTGHAGSVRDVHISRCGYPYLYSCGDAKELFNWDLTTNKPIRRFYGHFSGIYCIAEHPSTGMIVSGSRDSTAKVWDLRTQSAVYTLEGHDNTIFDVLAQDFQPNVVTASADHTIKLWDLRVGRAYATLTNHNGTIRALAAHPRLWSFVSASPDSILQWTGERGTLFGEFKGSQRVINALAINEDGVMVSAGNDGVLSFWDFDSRTQFQEAEPAIQPGSLEAERGIFAAAFDETGTRLITCECDKTVKLWRELDPEGKPYD